MIYQGNNATFACTPIHTRPLRASLKLTESCLFHRYACTEEILTKYTDPKFVIFFHKQLVHVVSINVARQKIFKKAFLQKRIL